MNKINKTISPEDLITVGRGKSVATLAEECLESLKHACPYNTTFTRSIPIEAREAAEKELKADFESWANCWIVPKLICIVNKSKK